ncbi:hypothetical protein KP79_PYT00397 [Mizuhopecten yessoensis]|uniref:Uncharacterized protein n=1 Tax=Mizuhopecten yessoensis TaxID=6573 RepID=A0A210QYT7_MIZYE|nr:hypothetical protein KP79_PYT00397 [Mizuhopecten yessoensis]
MDHFGMDTLEAAPRINWPPPNVERIHKEHRQKAFDEALEGIMKETHQPQNFQQVNDDVVKVPLDGKHAHVSVANGDKSVTLKIPTGMLEKGTPIVLRAPGVTTVKITNSDDDDLYNYVSYFLQHYYLILILKDAVAEGNIFHINIALKMMIPYFSAHSSLSKYMT